MRPSRGKIDPVVAVVTVVAADAIVGSQVGYKQ